MRRALPWLLGILLLGLLALAGADYLVWRWSGGLIGAYYADWRAAREAEGWKIESGAPRLTGWPFEARLIVPDFALKGGATMMPGGMSFGLPELDLAVAITEPRDLRITPGGTARATFAFLPPLAIDAAAIALHTTLTAADDAAPLAGEARQVTIRLDQIPKDAAQGVVLAIDRIDFLLSVPAAPPSLTLHLQASGIDLPQAVAWPFGPHIGRFSFDARLAPLLAAPGADFAATESAWRQAGGAVNLAATLTDWGGATMSGEAKLDLDDRFNPKGIGLLHLIDPDTAVAGLARQGMIPPTSVQAIGAVLHLLTHPATDGGKPTVDLPLSLADGVVSAGGIPLLRLSEAGVSAP